MLYVTDTPADSSSPIRPSDAHKSETLLFYTHCIIYGLQRFSNRKRCSRTVNTGTTTTRQRENGGQPFRAQCARSRRRPRARPAVVAAGEPFVAADFTSHVLITLSGATIDEHAPTPQKAMPPPHACAAPSPRGCLGCSLVKTLAFSSRFKGATMRRTTRRRRRWSLKTCIYTPAA